MNLEQWNDWPKYPVGCVTNMPNGCLINPDGSRLIFFEEIKHSPRINFVFHTHVFYKNHLGEPAGFNSSEKLKVNSAWEKW